MCSVERNTACCTELTGPNGAHHAVKGQDEAALGILICRRAVAPIPPALQVLELVVAVVQHRRLLIGLLAAGKTHKL